jgi:hypothetical protein
MPRATKKAAVTGSVLADAGRFTRAEVMAISGLSRMEAYALSKRVEATEKAITGLLEQGRQLTTVIEGFGDMVRINDARSKLALAIARGAADVDKLQAQFDELATRMTTKYGANPDG